jgi:hypothetical protein
MRVDDARLFDEHNVLVLPERTSSIVLLQMERRDMLHEVLDLVRAQQQPVFLLLPDTGEVFSQPEHFIALRHLLTEATHPPFLCLIIPPWRTDEASFAARFGIPSASSVEDALHVLVQAALPQGDHQAVTHETVAPVKDPTRPRQRTDELEKVELTTPDLRGKKRPFLLGAGSLALLVVVSVFLVPFMTSTPLHPKAAAVAVAQGTLSFHSSEQFNPPLTQGYNDIVQLTLSHVPAPPARMRYYAWLMPDDDSGMPLLLGTLEGGSLIYTSPTHANLLATYSGVRVTVQPADSVPETPSPDPAQWRWEGWIPNIPTPGDENQYSLLSHLRHLLAKDPTLQANQLPGGLDLWLTQNVQKVAEWASAAQGDWHGTQTSDGDIDQLHRQMLRILDYLDGSFYVWHDVPAGSPWLVDPQAGKIGLLDSVPDQEPPAYLEHVDIHLMGLASAPGHTVEQRQLATLIDKVITRMRTDLQQVRQDAANIAKMTPQQVRQPGSEAILDDLARLATEVESGWFDPQTGENIGGTLWINARLQQLAVVNVMTSKGQ